MNNRPCYDVHPNHLDFNHECRICWRATYCGQDQEAWGIPVTHTPCDYTNLPPLTEEHDELLECLYRSEIMSGSTKLELKLDLRKDWIFCSKQMGKSTDKGYAQCVCFCNKIKCLEYKPKECEISRVITPSENG